MGKLEQLSDHIHPYTSSKITYQLTTYVYPFSELFTLHSRRYSFSPYRTWPLGQRSGLKSRNQTLIEFYLDNYSEF